ncbi:MAG: site-specific integrase [Syntrophomonadaceae bacterium]|nr:site-specific integrase [Syntrophomonadaceae bacterium]
MPKYRGLKANITPTNKSLSKMIEQFIAFKRAQGLAERTLEDYNNNLEAFKKCANNDTLDNLEETCLIFFTRFNNSAPATYNIPYKNLNCFFNWLISQEYLEYNPLKRIGLKIRKEESRIRHHESDNLRKLLDSIDLSTYTGLRDYALILLTLDTEIRPSEAFGLKNEAIDFQHNKVQIKREISKTRTSRMLPLSSQVTSILEKFISIKPPGFEEYLFMSCDGNPMNKNSWAKRLYLYCEKAKIPSISPYSLRHCFAIYFLRAGGHVFALQYEMGHSDLSTTRKYINLAQKDP